MKEREEEGKEKMMYKMHKATGNKVVIKKEMKEVKITAREERERRWGVEGHGG